jgi:hypothetical protein
VPNDDSGKVAFVAIEQPLLQLSQLCRIHPASPPNIIRILQLLPATC